MGIDQSAPRVGPTQTFLMGDILTTFRNHLTTRAAQDWSEDDIERDLISLNIPVTGRSIDKLRWMFALHRLLALTSEFQVHPPVLQDDYVTRSIRNIVRDARARNTRSERSERNPRDIRDIRDPRDPINPRDPRSDASISISPRSERPRSERNPTNIRRIIYDSSSDDESLPDLPDRARSAPPQNLDHRILRAFAHPNVAHDLDSEEKKLLDDFKSHPLIQSIDPIVQSGYEEIRANPERYMRVMNAFIRPEEQHDLTDEEKQAVERMRTISTQVPVLQSVLRELREHPELLGETIDLITSQPSSQ